ncbi:MAG TPA: hypothetical protein VGS09_02785 [Actinomycetota bacterium]|jgi:hypothetical protein|nr:hypothetical protein [Actinomycetota bacterium]
MIRAEFFRPRTPETVIGVVEWDGRQPRIEAKNTAVRDVLSRIFRPTPVAVDDSSTRPLGASGETVLEPGDLDWFIAAGRVRSRQERLGIRFVATMAGGWDPAGAYQPIRAWVEQQAAGETARARQELGTVTEA